MPTTDHRNAVLLDTHALLWWQADRNLLSSVASRSIESATRILVSPLSFWELAMLVEKGRVGLDRPTRVWVGDFLASDRVALAELTPAIAVDAAAITNFHGDPADRIIVSTALAHGVALISKDDKIRALAGVHKPLSVIW
jgi:PIN domain nuclease of toxin-antitoxin system